MLGAHLFFRIDPFGSVDLATVDSTSLDNLQTMREAAESAETDDFNPQIDDASGDAGAFQSFSPCRNVLKSLPI